MVNQAIGLLNDGRRADGSVALLKALSLADHLEPPKDRQEHLGALAGLCSRAGFDELALMAKADQIALSESLGETNPAGHQMITLANLFRGIGNLTAARNLNEKALSIGMTTRDPEMVTATATNLATLDMMEGDFAAALPRLRKSLGWFHKADSPRNEMITRAMFLQTLDRLESNHEEALLEARPLFGRLRGLIDAPDFKEIAAVAERVAQRHLDTHSEIDGQAWKARAIPELWGA